MDSTAQDLLNPAGAVAIAAMLALATALVVLAFIKSTATKVMPVALLLAGFCLEVFLVKAPYVQIGLQIYPNDLISVFVLMAAIVGFAYRPVPINDGPFLLWLAFGVVMIASFVVGLNEYGRYAGTEVRPFFYMWVAGLYCSIAGFDEAELKRMARWCVWTAYALMAIALYYFVGVESGLLNRAEYFDGPTTAVFRPVGSHGTFFVGAVGLVQTMAWLRRTGSRFSGLHAALFIAFVVLMQHRSVWIATACGLLAVFVLEHRHLPRRFALMLGFALTLTFAIAVAGAAGFLDDLARRLLESTLSMDDTGGTFFARVDGWIRLWENWVSAPLYTMLFGYPFGHGYTRLYNGVVIEFAPHNFYLDLVLRVGVVGSPGALSYAPNFQGGPASGPSNGPVGAGYDKDNFLHSNPYPFSAAPGQPKTCEAGNEVYLNQQKPIVGNVPGQKPTTLHLNTDPASVKALTQTGSGG